MLRCPNCSYKLVLLLRRRKYKCAKCSKLFSQKKIDYAEFRRLNKLQKELDKQSLKQKKRQKLLGQAKKERAKIIARRWKAKNREKIRASDRERWHNGKRKEYTKQYYRNDLERSRLQKRILYYRLRQKELADAMLENRFNRAYTNKINRLVPTFVLCELLLKPKLFKVLKLLK